MLGVLGDAVLLVAGILLFLLITVKVWYPPLMQLFNKAQKDLDEVDKPQKETPSYKLDVDSQMEDFYKWQAEQEKLRERKRRR